MTGAYRRLCCAVVGDEGVGKSTLIQSYINRHFAAELASGYHFKRDERDGSKNFQFCINDMPSDFSSRMELYVGVDVIIICYDTCSRTTLESARTKWSVEAKDYCAEKPILLVGTKSDIKCCRHCDVDEYIDEEDAEEVAYAIGAEKHIKCSALQMNFVDIVFTSALRSAYVNAKKQRTRKAFDWLPLPNIIRSAIQKPVNLATSAVAVVKQACINVRENWKNPYSLTPTKSGIVYLAPCLAPLVPLSEDSTLEDTSVASDATQQSPCPPGEDDSSADHDRQGWSDKQFEENGDDEDADDDDEADDDTQYSPSADIRD